MASHDWILYIFYQCIVPLVKQ